MNKLAWGILFGIFLIGLASASDVTVVQGQYYTGTAFNTGTYSFIFTIYDQPTGGNMCFTSSQTLTTGNWGQWIAELNGTNAACNNNSKDYFLQIVIAGVDQSPRRRFFSNYNLTAKDLQNIYGSEWYNHTAAVDSSHRYVLRSGDSIEGNILIDGNLTVTGTETQGSIVKINLSTDLNPDFNNTFDLGNETNQWRNLWINNIYTPKNIFWYNFSTVDQAYTNSVNNTLAQFIANTYQTIANTFTKLEVVSMLGGNYSALDNAKLNKTDQRYNETGLILGINSTVEGQIASVNSTSNIQSLGFYNSSYLDPYLVMGGQRIYWFTNQTNAAGTKTMSLSLPSTPIAELTYPISTTPISLGLFITPKATNTTVFSAGMRNVYLKVRLADSRTVNLQTVVSRCINYNETTDTCGSLAGFASSTVIPVSQTTDDLYHMYYFVNSTYLLNSSDRFILNITATKVAGGNTNIILSVDDGSFSRIEVPSPVGVTDITGKLDSTDQRYNETNLINGINSTLDGRISSVNSSLSNYALNSSLANYLLNSDQRYNDTALVQAMNITNKNITVENINPQTNSLYSLGTSILRWLKGWFVDLDVSNNANIGGNITVAGEVKALSLNTTNGVHFGGNLVVDGNMSIKRPYGMFSSTEIQTISLAATAYPVTFNYTEDNYLVTKEGNTNFSISLSGDYLIELSAIADSGSNNKHLEIWVQKTNSTGQFVNVPRSNTIVQIPNANTELVVAVPFILDLVPSDKFRIMMASPDATDTRLLYTGPTAYSPAAPSIIMTIGKLSEITA